MTAMLSPRIWAALMAASAVVGWLAAPPPVVGVKLVKARSDVWQLPPLPRQAADPLSLTMAVSAPYWGAATTPTAAAAVVDVADEPKGWRVAALFNSGAEPKAWISFEAATKSPQLLGVGDLLPSGHKITAIGEKEVCVQIGKQSYRLGLERREP